MSRSSKPTASTKAPIIPSQVFSRVNSPAQRTNPTYISVDYSVHLVRSLDWKNIEVSMRSGTSRTIMGAYSHGFTCESVAESDLVAVRIGLRDLSSERSLCRSTADPSSSLRIHRWQDKEIQSTRMRFHK